MQMSDERARVRVFCVARARYANMLSIATREHDVIGQTAAPAPTAQVLCIFTCKQVALCSCLVR